MRFTGFFGNERTKEILSDLFDTRRIPHAILIDGARGAGKRTLATIIAAAAVCEGNGELPCGVCRQCVNAFGAGHPDIVSYGGGPRSFGIDLVRKIRLDAYIGPNDAKRKVYILENIENMTEQAQNALLKILEEPPSYVMFILTCDTRSHVLETVRSRTQLLSLGAIPEKEAAGALAAAFPDIGEAQRNRAARISGGNVGRAKLMLDEGFSEITLFVGEFVKALTGTDPYAFLKLSGRLESDGGLFTALGELLPALFRDAIAVRGGGAASLSGFWDEASLLSSQMPVKKLFRALETALESQHAADRYANLTLHLTHLFAQLWQDLHEEAPLPRY